MAKRCSLCGNDYSAAQTFCPSDGALLDLVLPAEPALGSVIANHRIIQKLGEGGMGQVYLAEHTRMRRRVALKVMRPDTASDPKAVDRFAREAQNASLINHPNVATVYEFGETSEGALFLSMEYVDGAPLSKILHEEGPMPWGRAAAIVRQAASALKSAHDLGMVHRDLKPDNIMMGRGADGTDQVKLVDFGISKVVAASDQQVTTTGLTVGTPRYMSPEQVAGGNLDGASDQFSLACTAFEMVTGATPFEGDTGLDQVASRLTGRPRELRQVRSDVPWPAALESVLERALALKPDQRFGTVQEFAEAFATAAVENHAPSAATAATQLLVAATIVEGIPKTVVRGEGRRPDGGGAAPSEAPEAVSGAVSKPTPRRVGSLIAAGVGAMVIAGATFLATRAATTGGPLPPAAGGAESPVAIAGQDTPRGTPDPGPGVGDRKGTGGVVDTGTSGFPTRGRPGVTTMNKPEDPKVSFPVGKPQNGDSGTTAVPAFSAELERLGKLAGSDVPNDLSGALTLSSRLLDRAPSARDSVVVLFEAGRALDGLGRGASACVVFNRAVKIGGTLPAAEVVRRHASEKGC